MIHQNISFIFINLLFYFNISAQLISSIQINGDKYFSKKDYIKWASINQGEKINNEICDSIKKNILNSLQQEGFYNADVNIKYIPVDSYHVKLIFLINENEPTYISKIEYKVEREDSSFIKNKLSQLGGKIFRKYYIENMFNDLLDYYENNGYPFASIKISSIYFYSDSLNNKNYVKIFLDLNKGEQIKIQHIEIEGNTKTKDYVILRELGITHGDLYNQNKIELIPARLNKLNFFEQIDNPLFYINTKGEGILKIIVKEKVTNNFDGIIGYVPGIDKRKGYFTGFVNIGLKNLFGTGRLGFIRWQKDERSSQEFELRYTEPWVFNFPINISANYFQRIHDTTYIQSDYGGIFEYQVSSNISTSFTISKQSTVPQESKNKIITVHNSSATTTGISLKIDTKDSHYAPRNGVLLNNSYKYSLKKINNQNTDGNLNKIHFQRLEIDFELYKEIFLNQVAAIKIYAREIRGSNTEISDLYFLGGTKTLRGYREKQFIGNRILWSNLEYRYLLANNSFAFLFLDTGYFWLLDNPDGNKKDSFKIGYGFGLNIDTSLGVLGVSFALAKGDSFSEGKIHFGIISEF